MAGRPATLRVDIVADAKGVSSGVGEADRGFARLGSSAGRAGKLMAVGLGLGVAAAGAFAVKVGVDAVKAAADMGETLSKVGVLFGPAAKRIETFADGAARNLGISKQAALDGAATFATFGKSAGKTGGDLAGFSTGLLQAAGDLASFNNASPEETIAAIGSGLRGEAEPLRQFGILLDDATLRQQALKDGLIQTTTQALTPQQKVLAAQAVILGQVGPAAGDFARTSGSLANQQKIAAAEVENLKARLGQGLLPIVTKAAVFVNQTVLPGLAKWGQELSARLGPAIQAVGAFITGKLVPAGVALYGWFVEKIAPGIRSAVIPVVNAVRSVFSQLSNKVDDNSANLQKLGGWFKTIAEFSAKYILPVLGKTVATAFRVLGTAIGVVIDAVSILVGLIDGAIGKLKALSSAVKNSPLGKVAGGIGSLFSASTTALAAPALMGPRGPLAGPAGLGLAGPTGRLGAAWSPFTGGASWSSGSSSGLVVLDRRTVTMPVTVQAGVGDPVAIASAVQQLLDANLVRLGRATAYGAGR
jgi:hypothetical protein